MSRRLPFAQFRNGRPAPIELGPIEDGEIEEPELAPQDPAELAELR